MSMKVPKQPLEYTLVGAVTFFDKDTLRIMGYNQHKLPTHNSVELVYSKDGSMDNALFIKNLEGYKYVNPGIIKEKYSLEAAEEEFPDIFI